MKRQHPLLERCVEWLLDYSGLVLACAATLWPVYLLMLSMGCELAGVILLRFGHAVVMPDLSRLMGVAAVMAGIVAFWIVWTADRYTRLREDIQEGRLRRF